MRVTPPTDPADSKTPRDLPHSRSRPQLPWETAARARSWDADAARRVSGISVMFPAYNDAETIGTLVETMAGLLPRIAERYEIIVVNDGSADGTAAVLAECADRFPFLRVITHDQNKGYGAALRSGFDAATMDWVFYTDGDGQYDPTEIVALLQDREAYGLVNGYKRHRGDGWVRAVVGRLYHTAARTLFGLRIRDVDCDFRLIRRELLREIHLTSDTGAICVELVRRIQETGCRIRQVPVFHYPRVSGRSQFFCLRRVLPSLWMLLILWNTIVVAPGLGIKKAHAPTAIQSELHARRRGGASERAERDD